MMLAAIGNVKDIQSIYMYGSSHYNQIQDAPVAPVAKIHSVVQTGSSEEEEKLAATYKHDNSQKTLNENTVALKKAQELSTVYGETGVASYDLSNPYEVSRMNAEGSLLAGMNVDMLA